MNIDDHHFVLKKKFFQLVSSKTSREKLGLANL